MNKTKIEWVKNPDGTQGFTSNPIKGYCPVACPYCYSRRDYDRFGWDKTIRFDMAEMHRLYSRQKPAGIFIGSMHEIFLDEYIEHGWTAQIINYAEHNPWHRVYLLTKQPQNLPQFSPFPDNCWVGVTATNNHQYVLADHYLYDVKATIKFISFEPLLESIPDPVFKGLGQRIDWLIIGGQSGKDKFFPPEDWIQEIESACDKVRIPIFEKDNLRKMWYNYPRREMPLEGNYANRRTAREG